MMDQSVVRRFAPALILAGGALAVIVFTGCHKSESNAGSNPGGPGAAAGATGGKGLYEANCMRCHTAGGPQTEGPKGMMKGPDLAKVKAEGKTRESIIAYVRDPKAQNPMSRMPKFGDRLADADLASLADFILSLK
jgi:mono/diheme cytochrome c family protein